jgi:CBS domain-containing protein
MTVASILAHKGRDVTTAPGSTTLADVADLLATHKIGAIVVTRDDGTVVGILSERDVVRQIAKHGAGALDHAAESCMTRKVISCSESDTIDRVMGLMTSGRFRHIPVMEKDRLVGLVSIGDVVKRKIEQAERDAEELRGYIATA